jgi:HlyD family secretion protein
MRQFSVAGAFLALVMAVALGAGCSEAAPEDIIQKPQEGKFEVIVSTTGELQARNSVDISGPTGARKAGIYQLKITQLVPEGTIVAPGDFVAELDKSEIVAKIKEVEMNLQKFQSVYTQV